MKRSVLLFALLLTAGVRADIPDRAYDASLQGQIVSTQMGAEAHNQPLVVNGELLLAGHGEHSFWDIADPMRPVELSRFQSPHRAGETESHSLSVLVDGERILLCTISGRGIDLWDVTDVREPELLSALVIEGIEYGDNSEAVWGVAWQGDAIYVGGTSTGLHVVDARDLRAPSVVATLTRDQLGGVSAGGVWAMGDLLVTATPKDHAGLATVDITDPWNPALLDALVPEQDSYIGGVYGRFAYLLTPLRTYDVTTDPSAITLVGSLDTVDSEYLSFGDHRLFLGALRPEPGVLRYDVRDPAAPALIDKIEGRRELFGGSFTDDQFSMPVGNLMVMSDDEGMLGSVLTVQDAARDTMAPEVLHVRPADGATGVSPAARIAVSLSDHVDERALSTETFVVREVGGDPLSGRFGLSDTVVNFWPDDALRPDTTYELVLPAGGVRDVVGNTIEAEFRSVFSTGTSAAVTPCAIDARTPAEVGEPVSFEGVEVAGATYAWDFGDGGSATERAPTHSYDAPGRFAVTLRVTGPDGARACAATQIVTRPPTEVPPTRSSTIAIDDAHVWTVDPDDHSVARFPHDAEDGAGLERLQVGAAPTSLAFAPDGTAWVTCRDADELALVDPATFSARTLSLAYGAAPVAVVRAGERMVVALDGRPELVVFEGDTESARHVLPAAAHTLAADAEGRVLAARFLSAEDRGEVYRVDLGSASIETLTLRRDPGPDAADAGRGVPNLLGALAISPDGRRLAIPSAKANTERGAFLDGMPLDPDNTVRAIVSVVDLGSGAEDEGARIDLDDHEGPSAALFSPRGDVLFVATRGTHRVDAFDVESGQRLTGFATAFTPEGLAIRGERLFVRGTLARAVAVHDVGALLRGEGGSVRALAELRVIGDEPLAPEVYAGKRLFFDASSPRMSQDGYLSCASCHPGGGHDGRTWDFSARGEGLRNTIDLRGRAGTAHGPVHWTANFDEIQDFENDIRAAFGGHGFMAQADFDAASDPLGEPKAGASEDLDALSAYVHSLASFGRSPHGAEGGLPEAAQRGRDVFERRDCLDCHAGERLTDSGRARHDVGTAAAGSGQRLGAPLDGFDTPTLRGLYRSAPYFHDGSAATLGDVLARHGEVPAEERADLVAFLMALDDVSLGYEEPDGPDAGVACDGGRECDPPPSGDGCGCRSAGGGDAGWLVLLFFAMRRERVSG